MYFTDGSNPPEDILQRFLAVAEATNGAIAVHCKAGLGRTGCVIGAYIMKHYQFTAEELIGWLRIVRPGSIIGPQQQYMQSIQHRMWQDGEVMRSNLAKEAALAKSATAAKASNNINGQSNKVSSNASSSKSIASSSKQQLPAIANSPNTSSKEGASGSSNSNSVNGITEKFRTASIDSNGGNSGSFLPQTVRPNSRSGSCSDVSGSSTPVPVSTNSAQTTGLNERTQGDDLMNRRYHMKAEHSVHSPDQSANSFSSIHAMDATANTSGNVSINSKPPSSQSQSSSFSNASPVSRMGKMLDINKKN